MICLTIFHEMEERSLKKLVTILFSVLLVFTTQSVSAEDQAAGSSSGLQAIPDEFIAIPVMIIFLIALGFLAKNYASYRYHTSESTYIEPAAPQKSDIESPRNQVNHNGHLDKQDKVVERKVTNTQEQAKIIALPEDEGTQTHTSSTYDESPLPKEYKILQVMAYLLIVSGLIIKFIIRRKKNDK